MEDYRCFQRNQADSSVPIIVSLMSLTECLLKQEKGGIIIPMGGDMHDCPVKFHASLTSRGTYKRTQSDLTASLPQEVPQSFRS